MAKIVTTEADLEAMGLTLQQDGTYAKRVTSRISIKANPAIPISTLNKAKKAVTKVRRTLTDALKQSEPKSEVVGNKKVLNAQKSTNIDGTKSDSQLETYFYDLLKINKINFKYQVKIVLMEGFKYRGKKIRSRSIILDFYLQDFDIYVDTKGFQSQKSSLQHSLLKNHLAYRGIEPEILLPSTKPECAAIIHKFLLK